MDFIFHGILGLVISKWITGDYLPLAVIFAILPDILGTTAFQYFKFKNSSKNSIKEFINDYIRLTKRNNFFSKWDRFTYRATHTLLSLLLAVLVAMIFFKNIWWMLALCYLSHFLIDIPTHEGEFAFKPFWPFSNWSLKGKSWATNPNIFLIFWFFLIVIVLLQLIDCMGLHTCLSIWAHMDSGA